MFVLLKDSENTWKPTSYTWKITFWNFTIPCEIPKSDCSDIFQVRWTNLHPSGVTFPQDSVYQKLLKSLHVWQSYSKKQKGCSFLRQCRCRHWHSPAADWKRPPGRPRRTWLQQVEEDIGLSVGAAQIASQDRSMWRTLRPSAGQAQQWVSEYVVCSL